MAGATIDDIAGSRDAAKDGDWTGVAWGCAVSIFTLFLGAERLGIGHVSNLMLDGHWRLCCYFRRYRTAIIGMFYVEESALR